MYPNPGAMINLLSIINVGPREHRNNPDDREKWKRTLEAVESTVLRKPSGRRYAWERHWPAPHSALPGHRAGDTPQRLPTTQTLAGRHVCRRPACRTTSPMSASRSLSLGQPGTALTCISCSICNTYHVRNFFLQCAKKLAEISMVWLFYQKIMLCGINYIVRGHSQLSTFICLSKCIEGESGSTSANYILMSVAYEIWPPSCYAVLCSELVWNYYRFKSRSWLWRGTLIQYDILEIHTFVKAQLEFLEKHKMFNIIIGGKCL